MTNANPVKVAMIGVGKISGIYLKNITTVFKEVELIGVCDLIPERAEKGRFVLSRWLVMAAAITVGLNRLPKSFCTISTGRTPPCSLPTTGLKSA